MKFNIENVLASGMETALEQNKDLFSKSSVLEKLAFKKKFPKKMQKQKLNLN